MTKASVVRLAGCHPKRGIVNLESSWKVNNVPHLLCCTICGVCKKGKARTHIVSHGAELGSSSHPSRYATRWTFAIFCCWHLHLHTHTCAQTHTPHHRRDAQQEPPHHHKATAALFEGPLVTAARVQLNIPMFNVLKLTNVLFKINLPLQNEPAHYHHHDSVDVALQQLWRIVKL